MINLIALFVALASAQDFSRSADELLAGLRGRDAFSSVEDCGLVDAKTLRPFTREEALSSLKPCFASLSRAYGAEVKLAADKGGLAVVIDAGVTLTSPLRRDLSHALQSRDHRLLGHPVVLRRAGDELPRASRLQESFDACPKPMVLRKIESSSDFLKHYGGCFKGYEIRPSPAHKLGLMVRAGGDVSALNGVISVLASNGEVELLVMAYNETLELP